MARRPNLESWLRGMTRLATPGGPAAPKREQVVELPVSPEGRTPQELLSASEAQLTQERTEFRAFLAKLTQEERTWLRTQHKGDKETLADLDAADKAAR